MQPDNKIQTTGFTLIELLVVISIIGILSSFAVVSLNSARVKARDAMRKADTASLRTALSLYYFENNDAYPVCGSWNGLVADFGASADNTAPDGGAYCYVNVLQTALTGGARPIMLDAIPRDPQNKDNLASVSATSLYRYVSNGTEYALVYALEEEPGILKVIRGW